LQLVHTPATVFDVIAEIPVIM